MNSTRFARYFALPIVSAGIIGGAALGLAGAASAANNADVRPPEVPILKTLISGAIGHAMAHDISDQLRELISATGFTITGGGEVLLLGYLTAQRPDHR